MAVTGPDEGAAAAAPDVPDALRERRLEKRLSALDVARVRRREQAALKQLLKRKQLPALPLIAGTITDQPGVDAALAARCEEVVQRFTIESLLGATPGVGPVRRHQIIEAFRSAPNVRVEQLTLGRRDELARLVRAATDTTSLGA